MPEKFTTVRLQAQPGSRCWLASSPELSESEDERIRKELITAVDEGRVFDIDKEVADRWIAWLEKQKEQKPDKVSVSEELYEHVRNACACLDDMPEDHKHSGYYKQAHYDLEGALKMMEKEQKVLNGSIVQAVQKPAEWSEEDEEMRKLLIAILEVNHPDGFFKANELGDSNMRGVHTEEIVSWLKSRRPPEYCESCRLKKSVQGWKPSEEQMCELNWTSKLSLVLESLYEQLKNL